LVEKQSINEQIPMEQGTLRENKSFNGTPDEHSNLTQNVKSSTNGSVSEVALRKTASAVPSFQELDCSSLAPVVALLNETSSKVIHWFFFSFRFNVI
jgi:hypothetical protein